MPPREPRKRSGQGRRQGSRRDDDRRGTARRDVDRRDAGRRDSGRRDSKRRDSERRDSRRDGGFGPHGPPREPTRERRPDVEPPDRGRDARKPAPLRIKGERSAPSPAKPRRTQPRSQERPARRRKRAPGDVETEIRRLGGKRADYYLRQLMDAADAYAHDRDREALRILRPLGEAMPDAPSVHELTGLAQYRLGNYRAAGKELERFVALTDSVEQHPVLMDCARAQKRWRRVDELWDELAAASPAPELVTEGRIVAAGALADRGRVDEAIALLDKKADAMKRPRADHLRLWYALADLEERAQNFARARALFARIAEHDPEFADVTTRRRALGKA